MIKQVKKIIALTCTLVLVFASMLNVNAATVTTRASGGRRMGEKECSGSIKRSGSGLFSGHNVKSAFEWTTNIIDSVISDSTSTQSTKGLYAIAKGAKKQSTSTDKKHIYYAKSLFKIYIGSPWGDVDVYSSSYTDKVTLKSNGSATVDWDI